MKFSTAQLASIVLGVLFICETAVEAVAKFVGYLGVHDLKMGIK